MNKHLYFQTFIITSIISLSFFLPQKGFGANAPLYSKILSISEDNTSFNLQTDRLGPVQYWQCLIASLVCNPIATPTPPIDKSINWRVMLGNQDKSNASFLTMSPQGKFLAYYVPAKLSGDHKRAHKIFALGQEKTYQISQTIDYWDLLTEENRLFAFSADDQKLLYLDDRDGFPTLYLAELNKLTNTKALKGIKLFSRQYSVSDFLFLDKNNIAFTANREEPSRHNLYKYNLQTKKLDKLAGDISYNTTMKKVGDNLLFIRLIGGAARPYVYNLKTKRLATFSGLPKTTLPEGITAKTIKIGSIQAVALLPDDFSKTKNPNWLIWLHGGPYRGVSYWLHSYHSYGGYDWTMWELAQAGVPVLKLDYHGSYGYGRFFAEAIQHKAGVTDVQDVISARNYLVKNYGAKNIYLNGNSYGGYLSLRSILEKTQGGKPLFAGAMSINGVTDWSSLFAHYTESIFNIYFTNPDGSHDAGELSRASIINKLDNLDNQPIVILQSEDDRTIPSDQAGLVYEKLSALGKNVRIVTFPKEDHVLVDPANLEKVCQETFRLLNINSSGKCKI